MPTLQERLARMDHDLRSVYMVLRDHAMSLNGFTRSAIDVKRSEELGERFHFGRRVLLRLHPKERFGVYVPLPLDEVVKFLHKFELTGAVEVRRNFLSQQTWSYIDQSRNGVGDAFNSLMDAAHTRL